MGSNPTQFANRDHFLERSCVQRVTLARGNRRAAVDRVTSVQFRYVTPPMPGSGTSRSEDNGLTGAKNMG